MNTLKKTLTVLTLSTLGLAFTAGAHPIVTDWNYIVNTAFTDAHLSGGGGVAGTNDNGEWGAPTTLTWGTDIGNGQSSISVADPGFGINGWVTGSIMTDGAAEHTSTLSHVNQEISGASLVDAVISTSIILKATDPFDPYDPTGPFSPPSLMFNIDFTETTNSGACADVDSPVPCNDIFVLDIEGAGFNPLDNTLNQLFPFYEHIYMATIAISGLDVLEDPVCFAAGAESGCIGLTTEEFTTNSFVTEFSLSHIRSIPEPSTIFLLGLALFGIAGSMRNKHI